MYATVIICTHNRSGSLGPCLSSVASSISEVPDAEIEILVVDNNSTDSTQSVISEWICENPKVTIRSVFESKSGLSYARNRGVKEALGSLLIMIDDDCIMDLNYISTALNYDAGDVEPILRGGSVFLGDPTDQPLTIKTDKEAKYWRVSEKVSKRENLGNSILGCNMVMRKDLIDDIGKFDVLLGAGSSIPGGEDTDYILRCYISGYTIMYAPDLNIKHFHGRKEIIDGYNLFRGYSIGSGALYAKYIFSNPNICRQFYWDLKKIPVEWVTKKNKFMPEYNFTMTSKVKFAFIGMYLYWNLRLRNIVFNALAPKIL